MGTVKESYVADRNLIAEFINGLQNNKYKYHQFYDTQDPLAFNWFDIQKRFKFNENTKEMPFMYFDIEVDAEEGVFPDPPVAKWPVNAIATMHSISKTVALFYIPPKGSDNNRDWETEIVNMFDEVVKQHPEYQIEGINFIFKKYRDDASLIADFWEHVRISAIVSLIGFNSSLFDIPYLVNRSQKIYGKSYKNYVSEFGEIRKFGEQYEINDYAFIDLLHLYKPQSAGGMAFGKALDSYKLDNVANVELGVGKLEYEGSLVSLYVDDPVRFFTYNIFDTILLYLLNRKLSHPKRLHALAKFANTPYSKALVGRSLLYQYDKLNQYWSIEKGVCSKLYNEEVSKVQ